MSSLSDFMKGAAIGALAPIEQHYEDERLEGIAKKKEDRAALAAQKMYQWEEQQKLAAQNEADTRAIAAIKGGTDVATERAKAQEQNRTDIGLNAARIKKEEGLYAPSTRAPAVGGLTGTDAKAALRDGLEAETGNELREYKKPASRKLTVYSKPQSEAAPTKRQPLTVVLQGGAAESQQDKERSWSNWIGEDNAQARADSMQAREDFRGELVARLYDDTTPRILEQYRNKVPITAEDVDAIKDSIVKQADAGLEDVSKNLQDAANPTGLKTLRDHYTRAHRTAEAGRAAYYEDARNNLRAAMGYNDDQKPGNAEELLWRAYKLELDRLLEGQW